MYRNFPVLESERMLISAQRYNRVRLALSWLDNPARIELTGMHDLELILNDNTWLCLDTGLGNLPVLAWKEFETERRLALHEPVTCRVDYYNLHAELIKDRVLEIMDRLLTARLQRRKLGPRGQIRPLRPPTRRKRSH
ncbi:MAG: hypothetical protein WDA11_09795 [Thiohalomonadaceae bacterium]